LSFCSLNPSLRDQRFLHLNGPVIRTTSPMKYRSQKAIALCRRLCQPNTPSSAGASFETPHSATQPRPLLQQETRGLKSPRGRKDGLKSNQRR
ncbi:MAG: hypothetical protein KDB01_05435, partial [Planctomycetaceae bacterium]|nr:hypothetical protein [Planctomycetaceae bacterium]